MSTGYCREHLLPQCAEIYESEVMVPRATLLLVDPFSPSLGKESASVNNLAPNCPFYGYASPWKSEGDSHPYSPISPPSPPTVECKKTPIFAAVLSECWLLPPGDLLQGDRSTSGYLTWSLLIFHATYLFSPVECQTEEGGSGKDFCAASANNSEPLAFLCTFFPILST